MAGQSDPAAPEDIKPCTSNNTKQQVMSDTARHGKSWISDMCNSLIGVIAMHLHHQHSLPQTTLGYNVAA